jgi:hypothetical protein
LQLLLSRFDLSCIFIERLLPVGDVGLDIQGRLVRTLSATKVLSYLDLFELRVFVVLEVLHLFLQAFTLPFGLLLFSLGVYHNGSQSLDLFPQAFHFSNQLE